MTQNATAYQKFIHESPRKLRLVADDIRGRNVLTVLDELKFSTKRSAATIRKILVQAQKNTTNNMSLSEKTLKVFAIQVAEGPRIKRWQPVSRGMAHSIIKRTSHVKITVSGESTEAKSTIKKEDK